jgi:hypothetical protein
MHHAFSSPEPDSKEGRNWDNRINDTLPLNPYIPDSDEEQDSAQISRIEPASAQKDNPTASQLQPAQQQAYEGHYAHLQNKMNVVDRSID